MDSETTFGPWVKRRRKALGLTQKELAERVGCSVITIHKIETEERRPSRQVAELLAASLEIPHDEREAFVRYARRERAGSLAELPANPVTTAAAKNFISPSLPASLTPLIGRQPELAAINQLLVDPACRLLTLLGTAGVGKTRLALQAAHGFANQSKFPDGVCFASLANVHSPAYLPTAIASAIGFVFSGPEEPETQLLNTLQDKEALLVLDGLEHVINSAGFLSRILQTATRVKLLVTSRERLNLNSEWVFEIHGLPVPKEDETEEPEGYSAVQLFIQHARQVRPDFALNAQDRRDVIRICQLVDGLPLAIELAATWVRLLSCQEIAKEIENSLDFLTTSARDVPERHRSLRAAFEHSWNLITEEEQHAMEHLSVFRGGFRREAALQVAGTSLPMLSALADKSLLKLAEAGRYDMHDLLRHYAATHLASDPQHYYQVRDRHARYYLDLLADSGNTPQAVDGYKKLVADLRREIANLRLAWDWVLEHQQLAEVYRASRSLARLYEFLSWRKEGEQMFRRAIQVIENHPHLDGDEQYDLLQTSVIAQLKVYLSWMVHMQGRLVEAMQLLTSSMPILRSSSAHNSLEERKVLADGLVFLGFVLHGMGENTAAREAVEEFLLDYGEVGDPWINAAGRTILGSILNSLGEKQAARDSLRQGLSIWREMDNPRGTAFCLVIFGITLYELGNYEEARQVLTESLVLSRIAGDTWNEGFALNQLGLLAMQRESFQEAFDLLSESYELFHELGERWGSGRVLSYLGDAALALHFPVKAEYYYLEALKIASTIHAYPIALQAAGGLAQLSAQNNQPSRAMELALHVHQHPATTPETKVKVARLRAELDSRFSAKKAALIEQQVTDKPLDLLLEEILATHWEVPM